VSVLCVLGVLEVHLVTSWNRDLQSSVVSIARSVAMKVYMIIAGY